MSTFVRCSKFHVKRFETYLNYCKEIAELEMQLREILSYIFIASIQKTIITFGRMRS